MGNKLRFLWLNFELRIRQTVTKFKLYLIRAERLKITITHINIFLINVGMLISVITG
ncbi:hypothetical protein D1872_225230 [compost metagenome]